MAQRTSRFIIGLFVSLGTVIGVTAVIWLGASKYFEKGTEYLTYFDESVQGLQVDSRVKYRGVDVGSVQRISVAPDNRLVEVLIKIDLNGVNERDSVTQLRSAGITGIVFVELDRRVPNDEVLFPHSGIKTEYPVIPSQLSQTKQMLSNVDRIMARMEQVDLKGISDQVKQTARAMEQFFSGSQMTGVMRNIDSTTAGLDSTLKKIDPILAGGNIEGVIGETKQGLGEAREGIAEVRRGVAEIRQLVPLIKKEIEELKTAQIAGKTMAFVEGMERRTKTLTSGIESTNDDIRRTVESLRMLIERLRESPSDLLFSRPGRDDRPEGGR